MVDRETREWAVGSWRRTRFLLLVERPAGDGPPSPEPGSLVFEGELPVLYVGRGWLPERGEMCRFADMLRGEPHIQISGFSAAATERAATCLRKVWRLQDAIASGRLGPRAESGLRALLAGR